MLFFMVVLVFSVVTTIIFYFIEKVPFEIPLLFFILGLSFGIFVGKFKKMEWDEELNQIMNRFDMIGILVLIVNVIYIFFHKTIIREITHIQHITCISFALVCGVMLGRLCLIFFRVKAIKHKKIAP